MTARLICGKNGQSPETSLEGGVEMEKIPSERIIEKNIAELMAIIENPKVTAKTKTQASEKLLAWVELRRSAGWDIDL